MPFNFRPKASSKYKNSEQTLSFQRQVTREESIIGGQTGIDPKKELFLQDYEADYEVNKSPLNKVRKLNITTFLYCNNRHQFHSDA